MCLLENDFDSVDSPRAKKQNTVLSSAVMFPLSSALLPESVERGWTASLTVLGPWINSTSVALGPSPDLAGWQTGSQAD